MHGLGGGLGLSGTLPCTTNIRKNRPDWSLFFSLALSLELFRYNESSIAFNLISLCGKMPGNDGLNLLELIRSICPNPSSIFVFFFGSGWGRTSPRLISTGWALGVNQVPWKTPH